MTHRPEWLPVVLGEIARTRDEMLAALSQARVLAAEEAVPLAAFGAPEPADAIARRAERMALGTDRQVETLRDLTMALERLVDGLSRRVDRLSEEVAKLRGTT